MNKAFGLDHQLIAINDIEATRNYLNNTGFNMTPIGKHPWGTSTSLAMFEGCLIEIMGIYDNNLIDEVPSGNFHFGRHIYENLQKQEGIALSAYYSDDILANIDYAKVNGIDPSGTLEFSREVTLPNGDIDHTKTSLATFPNKDYPRLSFFLCQQHRPELIYVEDWLKHENGVYGIKAAHFNPASDPQSAISALFEKIYGNPKSEDGADIFDSKNGDLILHDQTSFDQHIDGFSAMQKMALNKSQQAHLFAMDYWCKDINHMENILIKNDIKYAKASDHITLLEIEKIGNMVFKFYQS